MRHNEDEGEGKLTFAAATIKKNLLNIWKVSYKWPLRQSPPTLPERPSYLVESGCNTTKDNGTSRPERFPDRESGKAYVVMGRPPRGEGRGEEQIGSPRMKTLLTAPFHRVSSLEKWIRNL